MMATDPEIEKIAAQLYSLQNQGIKLSFNADKGSFEHVMGSIKAVGEAFNFKDRFAEMDKAAYAMDQYAASTSRVFGTTREQMRGIKTIAADSFNQITLMGGGLEDIQKGQESITKSFNTNVLATKQNILDLTLVNKTTGVAAETLVSSFRTAGFSVSHIKDEMQKTTDYARSVGVNVTETSERFTKNLGQLNLFNFQNGTEGLAKMAANSAMLGISMDKTFTLAEKLLDPQKAIDLSASLQRLGVTSSELLDPLRAMDLAQNDPEELQNQLVELSKQFVRTKEDGTFEIMPGAKRQLREIATELGMNANELADMALKSADFGKKMSEMRMPSFNMSEENKTLLANMAQYNKGTGQYEITYTRKDKEGKDETVTKVVSEIPEEDLDAIVKSSQPKTLEDLNKDQLSIQEKMLAQLKLFNESKIIGYAASEMGEEIIKGVQKQQENMFKDFNEKLLKSSENIFRKKFDEAYGKKMGGKEIESVSDLGTMIKEGMREGIISTFSTTKEVVKGMGEGMGGLGVDLGIVTQDDLDKLEKTIDDLTSIIEKGVGNLDTIINTGMKEITKGLRTIREVGGERVTSIFENIVDVNDFIMTKDGVYRYPEGDIMIGGTNLDGKNNKEIKENIGNISDKNEDKQIIVNVENTKKENDNLIDVTKNNQSSLTDTAQLMDFMKQNPKTNVDLNETIKYLESVSKNQKSDFESVLFGNENMKNLLNMKDSNNFDMSELTKNSLDITPLTTLMGSKNFNRTNLEERKQIVPTMPTPSFSKLEPSSLSQTQKIEFGNLEISLKVDIPNNTNISTDQVKEVLQTAMNSTEFKQKIVVAITEANSNYGLTSVGGTSNYGANKTNYSLNA